MNLETMWLSQISPTQMLAVSLVTLLVTALTDVARTIGMSLVSLFREFETNTTKKERRVRHLRVVSGGSVGSLHPENSRNALLVRACKFYALKATAKANVADLELVSLVETKEFASDASNIHWRSNSPGGTEDLTKLAFVSVPRSGRKVRVGDVDVTFTTYENNTDRMVTETNLVTVTGPTTEAIDAFFTSAVDEYAKRLNHVSSSSPIVLVPHRSPHPAFKDDLLYARYPLADVSFDHIHIPPRTKRLIIDRVEQFKTGGGKYAVAGVRRRLSLLLHGPPGTGKTSIAAALAHSLGRHVVRISLVDIMSDEELLRVLNETKYQQPGSMLDTVRLRPDEIVHVLEDLDACSDVVHSRVAKGKKVGGVEVGGATEVKISVETKGGEVEEKSKLTLSGVLNALDGIADDCGRVVVMTTNHPEMLDEALVRPGRVDLNVRLGYIEPTEALEMVRRFFPDAQLSDVEFVAERQITPATLLGRLMCVEGVEELSSVHNS